jgi:hypothetical protein
MDGFSVTSTLEIIFKNIKDCVQGIKKYGKNLKSISKQNLLLK